MLRENERETVGRELAQAGLDGWLIYDFRGTNPLVAPRVQEHDVSPRELSPPYWPRLGRNHAGEPGGEPNRLLLEGPVIA